ncbi:MAG: hypothetical protein A4E53_04599 [Pelotomaculum sp. PtaB.Bin104]|nr:MAG: hypothetical protein A4E53_04599 [Pelotomaculum sp. PtaB.Bin104]
MKIICIMTLIWGVIPYNENFSVEILSSTTNERSTNAAVIIINMEATITEKLNAVCGRIFTVSMAIAKLFTIGTTMLNNPAFENFFD